MRSVNKWRRLPAARRWALLEALAAVTVVRLGLRVLPWRVWERAGTGLPRLKAPSRRAPLSPEDIAWAVRRVSDVVPGATCLTQALAARVLLSRRGYASRLRIGVTRAVGERLHAHAWLESEGAIVLGGTDVTAYTPLRAARAGASSLSGIIV